MFPTPELENLSENPESYGRPLNPRVEGVGFWVQGPTNPAKSYEAPTMEPF